MKLKKLSDYENDLDKNLKIFLYGQSGVGKTTFANDFPGKKLLISTDGKFKHLEKKDESDVVEIKYNEESNGIVVDGWTTFKKVVEVLVKDNGKKYKTIIVDLLSDIYEMCRRYTLSINGWTHESDSGYGKGYKMVDMEFYPVIKNLLGCNSNVLVLTHEKDNANTGITGPNLQGSVITKLQGYVTLNGRIISTQKPGEEISRSLRVIPSMNEMGANSFGISRPIEAKYDALIKEINEMKKQKERK